uniref:C2H2-type domain-containing protein n=1 Tax=Glossina palpalis gambiensis TaxID=67801 RepID=A0A1B0BG91_9MUSC
METRQRARLRQASSTVTPPLPEEQLAPQHSCSICGSIFSSVAQLRQHARRRSCRGNLPGVVLDSMRGWPTPSNIMNRWRLRPPRNLGRGGQPMNSKMEAGLGSMKSSDVIDHLATHSTRSREAIKKRRQRRSYVSMVPSLRPAEPALPNIMPSEGLGSTNFSVEESQELVLSMESLPLNEEEATLRREVLASSERGADALGELTGCISRVHRNRQQTRQTTNQTALRVTNRARRAAMYRHARNEFTSSPKKLADLILNNEDWYQTNPRNMTETANEFCRILAEPSINDDEPIVDRRENIKVVQAISVEKVGWAMKSMKSDTPGFDNITLPALRKVSPNRLCLLFNTMLPITIPSILLRALHKILARRLEALPLHTNQRGFSRIDGCCANVFCLEQIVKHARLNGRPLRMVSIDISKAFDT